MPPSDVATPNVQSPVIELTAADRLAASRSRLRAALLEITHPPKPQPLLGEGVGGLGGALLARIKGNPAAAIALEAAQGWWRQHPMRKAGEVATDVSTRLIKALRAEEARQPHACWHWSGRDYRAPSTLAVVVPSKVPVQRRIRHWLVRSQNPFNRRAARRVEEQD